MQTKLTPSPLLDRLCAVAAMRRDDATDYRAMLDLAKSRALADPSRIPNAFRNNLMAGNVKPCLRGNDTCAADCCTEAC